MADTPNSPDVPMTEEALLADRMSFWSSFTSAGTMAAAAVIVLVIGMWVFLV